MEPIARQIHNEAPRLIDIPAPGAPWSDVETFALTFDGYERHGSFKACAKIGNRVRDGYLSGRRLPRSLDTLRTCLFFEQRRWRHFGSAPAEKDREYIDSVLERIREGMASAS